jgi:hypothetical protein
MTTQEYRVQYQKTRKIHIKIIIYNSDWVAIDEVTGLSTGGSYTQDDTSAIRRTCSLEFVLKDSLLPSSTSPFWLNKRFRLFTGIEDNRNRDIVWFNQGTYLMQEPMVTVSSDANSNISLTGVDLMTTKTGDVSGQLKTNIIISVDTPIHEAIYTVFHDLGYETKFNIESTDFTVPYQIEHDIGSTIWDVAEELTNLYMTYQTYYDEDGYLVFRRKPILSSDTVAWDFSLDNTKYLIQSIKNTYSDKNVKNYVKIWGKLKDDGSQASYEIEVRDANYPNCPFTIEKLGEPFTRDLVISEDNYYTEEQCQYDVIRS